MKNPSLKIPPKTTGRNDLRLLKQLIWAVLLVVIGFSEKTYAQFTFPVSSGPYTVTASGNVVILNDVANTANIPSGVYDSFTVTANWSDNDSGARSNEANITMVTSGGSVLVNPPTSGGMNNSLATNLTFSGNFTSIYNPASNGSLVILLDQTWASSNTTWSNISVTLFEAPPFAPPVTSGATDIAITSAKLNWNVPIYGTPTGYEYYYTTGFNAPSDLATVNQNNVSTDLSATISNLTQGTTYRWWVRALYDSNKSVWVSGPNFTTLPLANVPWSENFSSPAIFSQGWSNTNFGSIGSSTLALNPANGNFLYKRLNNLGTANSSGTFTTLNIGALGENDRFRFRYKLANNNSPYNPPALNSGNFVVEISTNGGASFSLLEIVANNEVAGWQDKVYDLSAYSGAIIQIKITANRISGDYFIGFDDFIVEPTPAFEYPQFPSVTDVLLTEATLHWEAPFMGTPTSYEYYYSTGSIAPDASQPVNSNNVVTALTASPNGLTGTNTYNWWVRAIYDGGTSAWVAGPEFTTLPLMPVVWTEGFDSPSMPLGWQVTNNFSLLHVTALAGESTTSYISKNLYGTGTNATGGFSTVNVGPLTANNRLRFIYKLANYNEPYAPPALDSGNFVVEISNNIGLSWTVLDTISNNGIAGWQSKAFDLADYEGEIVKLRITGNRISGDYFLGFDNFVIEPGAEFEPPVSLSVTNIEINSATLNWNVPAFGEPTGYEYYYSTQVAAPSTTAPINQDNVVNALAFTLNNLTPNTAYNWWVRAIYETGNSDWVAGNSFTTKPVASIPWTEGFATPFTLPFGWTHNNFGSVSSGIQALNPAMGDYIFKQLNANGNNITGSFTTLDIGPLGSDNRLKFEYRLATSNAPFVPDPGSGNIVVEISTNSGVSWESLDTFINNGVEGWQVKSYGLEDYEGEIIKIRITANRSAGDYWLGFDNFVVEPTPTYEPPVSLAVNNIAFTTAQLNWEVPVEGTPTGYEYYYSVEDTAPLDVAEVNEDFLTPDIQVELGELEPNTAYNWWVRAVYGAEGVSVWTAGESFTTKPLASVPWTEEFVNSSLPFSWMSISFNNVGNAFALNPGTGNYIYKNLSQTSSTGYFQTINIGQLGENDRLSFDFKLVEAESPYNPVAVGSGNFVVEISTDGGETFSTLDVIYNSGSIGWQSKTYNLAAYSGEIVRIKITVNRISGNYYIGFDNFTIEPTPAHEEPYHPTVTDTAITSATLNWEAPFVGVPLAYEYYYSTDATAPSQEMEIISDNVVTELNANLSDLTQGTTYHWWVRAIYDTDAMSVWVAGPTFNTGLLATVTWTESFDTNTLPQGWATSGFNVSNSVSALSPASGNYIYTQVYTTAVKSFSTINVGPLGENDRLKFEYKLADATTPNSYPGTGTGNFVVEISTDFGNTWATLETVHNNGLSGWQVKQYNLSTYEGEVVKIRVKVNQTSGDYYIGFDNFIIESVPLYDVPHSLTTTNVTINSAKLNWEAPSWGEPIGYEYYYATDNTTPSISTPINEEYQVNTLSVDISGLTSNTVYNWWVRAIYENENTSEWVASTLVLQPLASVVWTEDFGSMTDLPEGWSHNGTWTVGVNNVLGSDNGANIYMSISGSNQTRSFSTLNVGPLGENDRLKFYYNLAQGLAPYSPPPVGTANFVVEVSTDFGSNWEVLQTVANNGVAGWQLQVINLDAYSGEIVKVRITANWVYTGTNIPYCVMGFDNFTIEPIPMFDVPTDLTAQGGVTTAYLSWGAPLTGTPNGYEYFYTTDQTIPSDSDEVNESHVVTTLDVTLTDLIPNTTHNWWLRAIYSELDKSSWIAGPEFITQNIASVPWSENFESSNQLPFGWQISSNTIMIGGVTAMNPSSPKYIYTYHNTTTARNFSTINVGPLGENDRLVFDYKLANSNSPFGPPAINSGNFVLEVSTDFGASWTIIETVPNNGIAGWQQKIYNLSAYSGEIVQLKFTMNRISGSYYMGFDNFVIEPIPLFDIPNDLSVINGVVSANIEWAAPLSGVPTGYEYYYSNENIAPDNSAEVNENHLITALNGTMAGLTPNTTYQWWLRAVYGTDGASQWVEGTSFTTQALTTVIWTEDFTALGSSLPLGWTQNNSWIIGQHNALSQGTGTGNCIYKNFSAVSSGLTGNFSTINIGPLGVKDFLSFDYKLAGSNFPYDPPVEDSGNFVVEISTDHGTSWTMLETVINNGLSGWQNKSYNLAAYSGEIVKIRITANRTQGSYNLGFDNFVIEPVPVYDAPVNPSYNLGDTWAELSWQTPLTATPTGYEYYYSSDSTAPSDTAEVNLDNVVSGLNATISDLYLNLTYNWWVRAVYGTEGTSVWVAGPSFMTEPLASVPWSEQFPNFTIPGGWNVQMQGFYYFSVGTKPALEPGDGNYIMSMSDYTYTSSFSTINIGQLGANDILKFDYKITNTAQPYDTPVANNGKFTVEISTNHGTTWELLGTVVNNGVSGWKTQLYNLSAYSGEIIRLRFTLPAEQSVYNFGFDNFVIEPGSEFDFPVPTLATDINFFSATLNWNAPMVGTPTGYEYYYSNTGATPSDSDEVNEDYLVTTLNATVSGLLQGTTYNWWIRAVYPSGNSPWLSGVTFTTVPLASVTWEENFAQYELPEGWSLQGFNYNTIGTILPLQPGTGNYIYTSLMNNQPRSFSTVDVGPLGANDRLKFSYKHALLVEPYESPGEGSGNFVVEISTDFGTTWTVLDTVLNNDIEGWQNKTYSLSDYSGEIVKIRIKMNWASSVYYLGFDNFLIEPQPVFEYPLTLHTTNIKLYSAVLNWQEPYEGTPIGYEYYYSDSSTPSDDDVVNSDNMVTDLYVSLSGLTSNTTYNWWVRALYEDGMSDWEAADSFITQPLAAVTWTENFATSGSLPLGWNNSHENNFYKFNVSSPYGMNMEPFDYSVFKQLTAAESSTGSIYTTNVGPLGVHDRLKFIYRLANTTTPFAAPAQDSGNFVLEISTDEGETWTVIDTVINNGIAGWQEKVYSLQEYNTEVIKLKITANWASGSYNLAFDNFIIEPTPEFDYPIHPENGHTWLTTANLSWDAPHFGVPSGYEFYYSTDDVAPFDEADVNTDNVVTEQNATISGLTSGTTYNWWIRALYPTGQSIWIEAEPFTTQWLTSVTWEEDFTNPNVLPLGWSHSEFGNVGVMSALEPGIGYYIHKTVTTTGGSSATNSGPNGSFSTINIGPLGANDRLKFDYKFKNIFTDGAPGEGTGHTIVEISTDGGLVWETLENIPNNGIEGWQNKSYNLSDYNGEIIKVRISVNRESGYYHIAFDNFLVEAVPVLEYPMSLSTTFVGLTTANLAWEAPVAGSPENYEYYFSTENTAPSNAAAVNIDNVVTDLNADISELLPNTTYNWWVRAIYDNGESNWAVGGNFTTQPLAPIVWSEGFNNATTQPLGWTSQEYYWSAGTYYVVGEGEGNYIYTILTEINSSKDISTINVGPLTADNSLTFSYKTASNDFPYNPPFTGTGNIVLNISTDAGQSWIALDVIPNNGVAGWQDVVYDLSDYEGEIIKVKIIANYLSGSMFYVAFDNFRVGPTPATSVDVATLDNVPAQITEDDGTLQLVATVNPLGAFQSVIWSIESGLEYASIDQNGLVTAIDNGTVTVRATSVEDATLYDEVVITITNQILSVTSVEVSTQNDVDAVINTDDGVLQLVATVMPSNSIQTVIWSIESGSEYASVNENGLVTAIDNGTVTVRATSVENPTVYDEITITITNQIVPATAIVVSTQDDVDAVITTDDGILQLVATVTPSNSVHTVTWSVQSGSAFASVDENGLVTALDNGTVTVRATSTETPTVYGEITITITNQIVPVSSVVVSTQGSVPAVINTDDGVLQLIATVNPSNAIQTVVWTIESGAAYATLDENGLLSALNNGTVTVRATSTENDTIYGEITVTITNQMLPVYSVVVTTLDNVMPAINTNNGTLQLIATLNPSNSDQTVVWSIESGAEYAIVDENGLVTALDNGQVTVRATSAENTSLHGEITITITNQLDDVVSVIVTTLDDVEATITTIGESLQLVATVNPTNSNQEVIWSIESGAEFATVNSTGLVTALANGVVVVRATSVENDEIYDEIEIVIDALSVDNPSLNTIKLYPNPTDGLVYLSDATNVQSIEVFNLRGQKLMTLSAVSYIDLTQLNTGTYLIKIKTDRGTSIQKVIKN